MILVVALAFGLFTGADAVFARTSAAEAGIPLPICVARVAPGDTPAAMLAGGARFDCVTPQHRLGSGDYWALSAPVPDGTAPHFVRARIASLWQSQLTLYALYADGKVAIARDTSATLSRRIQLGAIVEIALPVRRAPVTRLLWRVDGTPNARGILLGQHLASPRDSAKANTMMAAMYGGFGGLGLALLIYNLALWVAIRHRFQLAYCAMVAALLVYAISSSGALAWLVPTIDNNDRIRLNYALLGIAAAAALVFARTFFERRVFDGWLSPVTTVATALLAGSGLTFALLSSSGMAVADRLCSWTFILGLSVILPILWRGWRRGSAYLWIFALAWATPVLFAGTRILAAMHVIPSGFWIDNSTVLSLAFESLVSSIAIAYRVQMLSRERDRAREGETAARLLADADPLTGLLNRRAFLTHAIGRAGPQTLHIIDIDHFKAVNETLGHDGGDEVLRVFARTLRTLIPEGALVSRIGGEEFAIVVDAGTPFDVERILSTLRAARMPFDLTVTSSVGSCTGPLALETDWKKLYHNADRALFEAKTAGRDRARRAPPLAMAA